ncbi:hypothetical protein OROGR_016024 [Orobanche gracilis]
MSQRKYVNGRPSGTDGSDFSYRMVVDSNDDGGREKRWNKREDGKLEMGFIQFLAALVLFLSTLEGPTLDGLSVFSSVIFFVSLLLGELGRKRSRVNLLKLYMFGSSVAILISIVCLIKSEKATEIIKDLSRWETSRVELLKIAAVLLGLLVQIFAFGVSTSLIHNMAPPKRTS